MSEKSLSDMSREELKKYVLREAETQMMSTALRVNVYYDEFIEEFAEFLYREPRPSESKILDAVSSLILHVNEMATAHMLRGLLKAGGVPNKEMGDFISSSLDTATSSPKYAVIEQLLGEYVSDDEMRDLLIGDKAKMWRRTDG